MKKIFSTLAIAAISLTAAAQLVPNGINYQGATDKANQEITVSFILVDETNQPVYTQTETVTTTPAGTFTAVVGKGEEWNVINWEATGYVLQTKINDVLVSEAPLNAVPYANMASRYVGQEYIETDIDDLRQANLVNRGDINVLQTTVAELDHAIVENHQEFAEAMQAVREEYVTKDEYNAVNENVEGLVPVVEQMLEDIKALQGSANNADDALVDLVPTVKGLVAHAAEQDLINDNLELLVPQIEAIHEALETNESEHGFLLQEIENVNEIGIVLERRMNEAEAAIITNAEGIEAAQGTLVEIVPVVKGLQAHAAEQDLINDNLELLVPQIEALHESVAALEEGLATSQNDLVELAPVIKGLQAQAAEQALINDNLEMLIPIVNTLVEQKDAYEEQIFNISSDVQGLTEAMRGKANVEDLESINTALEYVTSDVQGIMETLRGKADISDYSDMKAEIETLRLMVASLQDAVTLLTNMKK